MENFEPILDGVIYQAGENEMIEDSKYIMPNIKWEDSNNVVFYKAFIEELCLHIWEELRKSYVTSVEWRYALPISLENSDSFHKMWRNDIQTFLKQNIDISHTISQRDYSESEAASLYFLKSEELKAVNRDKDYMVVDIGGGSIDIAVWQKQNEKIVMIAQTSVPVAGRLLFTRWIGLMKNEIQEQVFAKENPAKIQLEELQTHQSDPNLFNVVLERIINHNDEKIMNSYRQNPEWSQRLRVQLEFGIALLFFSLGSLSGYLQKIDVLKVYNNGNFSIALGGNGSKILEWMKMGNDYEKLLKMFLGGIISRNIYGYSYNPQIIRSKNPKEEVAYGLVQDEWENIDYLKSDIKEYITDELAINWNRAFIANYNEIFNKSISIDYNDIRNLMTNVNRQTDVCNFFMKYMYDKYYKSKIKSTEKGECKTEKKAPREYEHMVDGGTKENNKVISEDTIPNKQDNKKVSSDGKLLIYDEDADAGDFFVKPIDSNINEKDYQFSGISNCFDLNQSIKSGCVYDIVDVKKPCIMEKKRDCYYVKEKGELEIKKIDN